MVGSSSLAGSLGRQTVITRAKARSHAVARPRSLRRLAAPTFLFLTLMLQLWVRVTIIEGGYDLERLRAEAVKSDALLRQLKFERALVTRPGSLTGEAARRLGFEPTMPAQIRKLERGE